MAALSDNARAWKYTSDDLTTFRLRAKSEMVAQQTAGLEVKVGGEAADTTDPLPPRGFRPRKAYVVDSATKAIRRAVVVYEAGAPLMIKGETITLRHNGVDTVFETVGRLGERVPGGITQAT